MAKSLIKQRREAKAICSICFSPDYSYTGRANEGHGKRCFKCNGCGAGWQYGNDGGIYFELANPDEKRKH